jgi:predicted dehydrogenase
MALGIGLIGLGRHGLRYAQHLLEPLPNARLVAVCRRDATKGRAFAAEHGLRFHADHRQLIADAAVQAIVVVTPPSLSPSICLEGVRAGKPLLVEKPLACSGSEARTMTSAAEKAGVPLMVAQTLRFDEAVRAFKMGLGAAGPRRYLLLINRIEPRPEMWRDPNAYAGRGVLLEIGIHLLDLIRYLTGEEIAEVRCEMDRTDANKPECRALVSLRTQQGFPCILDTSRIGGGRMGRAEWIGDDGQMIVDWVHHRLTRISHNATQEWTVPDRPTIVAALEAFAGAVEAGTPVPITGRDGQKAVEIADACYESAAAGRTIRLYANET